MDEEELDMSFLDDMVPQEDVGKDVPQTPPMTTMAIPPSPRASATSRAHDETPEEDHSSKKPKVETGKKQRIEVVKELHAAMIRSVKFGEDEFYIMDKTMTQTTTMMTKILLMMFGWMKTPCSSVGFLKRCGQMPLRTKPQDHQSSGLTSLQMRLKSQGF